MLYLYLILKRQFQVYVIIFKIRNLKFIIWILLTDKYFEGKLLTW